MMISWVDHGKLITLGRNYSKNMISILTFGFLSWNLNGKYNTKGLFFKYFFV